MIHDLKFIIRMYDIFFEFDEFVVLILFFMILIDFKLIRMYGYISKLFDTIR